MNDSSAVHGIDINSRESSANDTFDDAAPGPLTLVAHTQTLDRDVVDRSSTPVTGLENDIAPWSDWSEMAEGEHFAQFYESDSILLDAVAGYIGNGLRNGGAGITIMTAHHQQALDDRLRAAGVDVDAAQSSGRYIVRDATKTIASVMVDGALDAERFDSIVGGLIRAAGDGGRQVRAFGEMVALLVRYGLFDETLEMEALWNKLQRRMAFSLFCAYPMEQTSSRATTEFFNAVSAAHTRIIPSESYTTLPTADDRLRAIADLQQKASWLEVEVARRREAEDRLLVALANERSARQEAEVAVRQRDEFLSIAAHELRTPLTSLSGQAQLALRQLRRSSELDRGRVTRSVEVISGQAHRLALLLNQLLDISRLETGKLTLDRHPTELTELVASVVAIFQPSTDRHSIRLTAPSTLQASVDPLRVEQLITNLLDNAIKYSPNGGEIHVALAEPSTEIIEVSVRDHGIGIPADKRTRIFERFYQAHEDNHANGLGLGLYISRQIVELHGGRIEAEHPAGGGVCFRVRLPKA